MSKAAPTSAKGILKAAGLTVAIERDATVGHEYLVERDGRTVASGWNLGTKTDAYEAALSDARAAGLIPTSLLPALPTAVAS
jgi:hypothetical protein